jgi:hypothetical protein
MSSKRASILRFFSLLAFSPFFPTPSLTFPLPCAHHRASLGHLDETKEIISAIKP